MWWNLLWLAAVFAAVLIVRALRFRPRDEDTVPDDEPVETDANRAIESLGDMIRCKTVSHADPSLDDPDEFEKFRRLLQDRYPRIHAACSLERVGPSGLVYKLPGRSGAAPSVLMAHYDVVPVDQQGWEQPPFDGKILDGVMWGRGALDTKSTLAGVMEAVETLLERGFVPANDLYLTFGGDEEVNGASQEAIVKRFSERGVRPAFVLDEGGAIVSDAFPGVAAPCAMVGIGEKGVLQARMTIDNPGGHASAPPRHTSIGRLSRGVVRIENHPFPQRLTKPVKELLDTLGRHSNFGYRLLFANLWCFLPVFKLFCTIAGGEMNAMMRTTCAFTQMQGSAASNVLPSSASMSANLRLVRGDTGQSVMARLKRLARDPAIRFSADMAKDPSPFSETRGAGWELLCRSIRQTWPDTLVSPYLMVACSDARHYHAVSEHVYRFTGMTLSKEERGLIHGNNERIPLDKIEKILEFYIRLTRRL